MGQDNFTFSLDKDLKKKMKRYKEVNWSEIFRIAAKKKIKELDNQESNVFSIQDITQKLSKDLLSIFETKPDDKDEEEYQKLRNIEEQRIQKQKSLELED